MSREAELHVLMSVCICYPVHYVVSIDNREKVFMCWKKVIVGCTPPSSGV